QKFTHAAMATARLCVANALDGASRPARELVVPHCTYTDPDVAQAGLTPRQAQDEGIAIDKYRLQLGKVERAFIDGDPRGGLAFHKVRACVCRAETTTRSPCYRDGRYRMRPAAGCPSGRATRKPPCPIVKACMRSIG